MKQFRRSAHEFNVISVLYTLNITTVVVKLYDTVALLHLQHFRPVL